MDLSVPVCCSLASESGGRVLGFRYLHVPVVSGRMVSV